TNVGFQLERLTKTAGELTSPTTRSQRDRATTRSERDATVASSLSMRIAVMHGAVLQGGAISSNCQPVSGGENCNTNNVCCAICSNSGVASLVPLLRACPASASSTSSGAVGIRLATTSG